MRKYDQYGSYPHDERWERGNNRSLSTTSHSSSDYLLEAVEQAMDRDPDQEFDLLLVLERKRD